MAQPSFQPRRAELPETALLTALFGDFGATLPRAQLPTGWQVVHHDPRDLPAPLRRPELADMHALARVYRGRVAFTRGPMSPDMVPVEKVGAQALWKMGLTVYFQDVAPYVTGLDELLRRLEMELGVQQGCARIGAFASPPGDGLACHYDAEDVISIQLSGRKRFHLAPVAELPSPYGMQYSPGIAPYDELYPQVAGRFPDWRDAPFENVDLQPGSVLFMPRGIWHRSEALSESLSVSIILRPPTRLDSALEQLRQMLMQDERWRRPVYGVDRDPALNAELDALLTELPLISGALLADDLLHHNRSEAGRLARLDTNSRFQVNPVARIETMSAARTAGAKTLLIKTVDDRQGERMTARLELAPEAVAVFEWLAARSGPFTARQAAAQFPAFPLSEHLEILRAAVKGQLLRLLWYPAAPR